MPIIALLATVLLGLGAIIWTALILRYKFADKFTNIDQFFAICCFACCISGWVIGVCSAVAHPLFTIAATVMIIPTILIGRKEKWIFW